ncbi:MAG: hypothetical protein ABMB14_04365 [Myxococcota bacterium]
MTPLPFAPGDLGPGEDPDKVAASVARFACADADDDASFDLGYRLLDAQFGAANELERREVLAAWFRTGSLSPPGGPIHARYHLVLARDRTRDGAVAAVRDGFSAVDVANRRVVSLMSHSLVLPDWRRTGVAALLRAAPVVHARTDAAALGVPDAEIVLVAEMEMTDPTAADTAIRLIAYRRAGFKVVPPPVVPYAQPDFRDCVALGIEPVPLPFVLLVRQVGEERRDTLPAARAIAILDHLAVIHRPAVDPRQLGPIRAHALRNVLDPRAELPLWDLPTGPDDTPRLTALSKDRLLPLYPEAWRPR